MAITGIRNEDTMQIRLSVGEHEFTALIDTGSTHNFISTTAARRAGLNFHSSHGAHVVVANGDRVACRGLARDVGIRITQDRVGHTDFSIDCYSIPLDCYDMVLVVAFLCTLGPILWDFNDLCMAFWHQGRRVFWKGVGSTRTDIAPTGRLHTMRGLEPALLERLLQSFDDVFATPKGLPPARPCDHRIGRTGTTTSKKSSRSSASRCKPNVSSAQVLHHSPRLSSLSRNKTPPGVSTWIIVP
jgi:hypothetical protein